MTSATTSELSGRLTALLEEVQRSPVTIRDGDRDVAVLVSMSDFEDIRLKRVERFEAARDAFAAELAKNLARDGLTVEEFLDDLLKND